MSFRNAFTLIELLVVIAIIGILSGLIVVSMSGVTSKATIAKAQVFSNSLRNSLMLSIVSDWKLDNASGTSATDTWNGTNNGTLTSFADTTAGYGDTHTSGWMSSSNCVSGTCLKFDGADDYITFGNNSSLKDLSSFTIELWYNPFNIVDRRNIVDKFTFSASGWQIRVESNKYLFLISQPAQANLTTVSNLNLNNWNYIVCSFDGIGAGTSVARIYLNGSLEQNVSNLSPLITNNLNLNIGTAAASSGAYGLIDGIRIYNSAIPISQIKEQYYVGINKLFANGSISKEDYLSRIDSVGSR